MTLGQGTQVGSFNFPIIRIVLGIGLLRIFVRGEWRLGAINQIDWLVVAFCCWALISSLFHKDPSAALKFALGFIYNVGGLYFLVRSLCRSLGEAERLFVIVAALIVPVAVAMLFEKRTGHNLFSLLGSVPVNAAVRNGSIRAQGPFGHAILAGTVGAVTLPLMVGIFRSYRKVAVVGMAACFAMIFSSASSGPILSVSAAISALAMWKWRYMMRTFRWLAILVYVGLDVVMQAPPYYLIGRIDLTGGSTGWHRARLIESALSHLDEWWLVGTDYTRHWMPTGVSWSSDHTDITNYYIKMGVMGGLPLMLLLIGLFITGFSYVGKARKGRVDFTKQTEFLVWSLGASLFAHAATCISVSYFDQSFLFLYLTLATISSVWTSISSNEALTSTA